MTTVAPITAIEPIAEEDDFIRAALMDAEIPALLPAIAQATGDLSILRDDLRPDPSDLLGSQGGLSEDQLQLAREVALEAIKRFRDGGCRPAPPPTPEVLSQMIRFTAGALMGDEYVPFLSEQLGLLDQGASPDWSMEDLAPEVDFRVVVIGAGISGLAAAYRLKQRGVPFLVIEKNADVGGTWFENIYPGCRVDVANHLFSYSFAQNFEWGEHFSGQGALLGYLRNFADERGLRDHIRFETEVESAEFSDDDQMWSVRVRSRSGVEETLRANVVISAVGQLNRPNYPDIPGRDDFAGPSFHSARWDPTVELKGKVVAVIGTGASALQLIPEIAAEAGEVLIFQRTPPWLAPTPDYHDRVADGQQWLLKHVPSYSEWYRFWLFCTYAEGLLPSIKVDPDWDDGGLTVSADNEALRQGLVQYLEEQLAGRPDLIAKVVPQYPPAAKRMLRDNGIWARTLMRDNVQLITDPIDRITADGVVTRTEGTRRADVLIFATGFQASKFLMPMTVKGRHRVDLHEAWHGDARAYLGMTVPGFPNMFVLYGPNTNIVVNGSIIFFSECSVGYVVDAIRLLLAGKYKSMECREDVYWTFNHEIDDGNRQMSWGAATVNSWYKNALGRVSQNWPFALHEYWRRTRAVDPSDYILS